MDQAALDDKEIAAQLHRELNGLSRRAPRSGKLPAPPFRKRKARPDGSPAGSGQQNSRPSSSPAGSSAAERDHPEGIHSAARRYCSDELREAQETSPHASELRFADLGHSAASTACGRARGTAAEAGSGGRSIKCFCAGMQWGVAVSRSALQDRPSLAAVLQAALGERSADCIPEQGDCEVLMLDQQGRVSQFPAGHEPAAGVWGSAAETAVRVYVR